MAGPAIYLHRSAAARAVEIGIGVGIGSGIEVGSGIGMLPSVGPRPLGLRDVPGDRGREAAPPPARARPTAGTTDAVATDMTNALCRATALSALLLVVGCADPNLEPGADATGATTAGELDGVPATASRNVVAIQVGGQLRTGVLLDHRRALLDASALPTATVGADLTVTYGAPGPTQTRVGRHLDRHPNDPRLAIVQIDPPFNGAPTLTLADPTATLPTNTAVCAAATSPTTLVEVRSAWAYLPDQPVPILVGSAFGQAYTELDLGVPCFRTDGALLGLMAALANDGSQTSAIDGGPGSPPPPPPWPRRSANAWVNPVFAARSWIANLGELARVRALRDAGSLWVEGPLSLATTTTAGVEMCMDIPWGSAAPQTPVNQYPCHGGKAQQFYLEWDLNFWTFRVISNASGLCLDVAGASTTSGALVQQYGCHGQLNQRWRPTAPGGVFKLRADHAPSLCASARTGLTASTPGLAITDRTCVSTGDTHQRWHRIPRSPS
jgi:hypothetical protein